MRQFSLVKAAHAPCFPNSLLHLLRTRLIAFKYLIVGGVHNVVFVLRILLAQRIGARRDGLRLKRFQRKAVAHLIRHYAQQVILHMDGKNRTNFFFHDRKPQITHVQGGIVGQAEAVLSFSCAGVTRQADLLPGVYAHALIIHIQAAALEQHGKLASL